MYEAAPRAWRVHRLGAPDRALRLEAATVRPPGPGEAAVAVEAAGVNFPDLLLCAGRYQERPALPFSPGFEAAGRVVSIGPGSQRRVGERVIVVPELPDGGFQERLTVPDAQLYPVPDEVDAVTAAVLNIAYGTAHVALHERAGLQVGETLLVNGGAGGVSSAAIQLGRAAGARVLATATGAEKAAACRRLGADTAFDLERTDDVAAAVRDATGGRGADVIVDVVGGEQFESARRCVAFGGRLVVVGFTSGTIPSVPANHVLLRNYSVVGLHLVAYRRHDPALLRRVHEALLDLLAAGRIAPHIHAVLPFESLVEALRLVAERRVIGRVALSCGPARPA
jgi:NADPH2:quinone reductase